MFGPVNAEIDPPTGVLLIAPTGNTDTDYGELPFAPPVRSNTVLLPDLGFQVQVPWIATVLIFVLPAIAGCRIGVPIRPSETSRAVHTKTMASQERSTDTSGQPVMLARFEQPEPLPPVVVDEEREAKTRDSSLTLADLEGIALQSNPSLLVAAARMNEARGKQIQAGLYPNPVVGYHGTEIGNLGTAAQQGAFVSQRFITGGKLRLDQAIAGHEIDDAQFRAFAQQLRVLNDVRVRFFEALAARHRFDLAKQLAKTGDDVVIATERLLAGRLGTENDLLQAQIKADQFHVLLDNATNARVEARRRLAAVVGIPDLPGTELVGELDSDAPRFQWDACYATVLGDNPDLNAARARVNRANIAVTRAQQDVVPDVDVSVSVRHHNVTHDDIANIQIGIPIPVFDKNQGNVLAARARWVAASNEVRRIELQLLDRLAVTYRRYENARQQVQRYQTKTIDRAKRSLDLVTSGYDKGQVPYLTLLTAQQTYLQVSLSYLDSLRELRASSAIIEGQLLGGSLTDKI